MTSPSPAPTSPTKGLDTASMSEERRHWETVAEGWASTGRDSLWRRHSDAVNCSLIEEWAPPKGFGTLLKTDAFDEAASRGLVDVLESHASLVVFTDLSFRTLRSAQKNHRSIRAVCCDVQMLPFAPGSIGAVVSTSTLDHFPVAEQITTSLREISRVLGQDGQLILTMDNPVNPAIALRMLLPWKLLHKTGLVPYYVGATLGPTRLGKLLVETGFRIQCTTAVLHCPRVLAILILRLLQRHGSATSQKRFLSSLGKYEWFRRWPTRFLSGYFVAIRAIRSPRSRRPNSRSSVGR